MQSGGGVIHGGGIRQHREIPAGKNGFLRRRNGESGSQTNIFDISSRQQFQRGGCVQIFQVLICSFVMIGFMVSSNHRTGLKQLKCLVWVEFFIFIFIFIFFTYLIFLN